MLNTCVCCTQRHVTGPGKHIGVSQPPTKRCTCIWQDPMNHAKTWANLCPAAAAQSVQANCCHTPCARNDGSAGRHIRAERRPQGASSRGRHNPKLGLHTGANPPLSQTAHCITACRRPCTALRLTSPPKARVQAHAQREAVTFTASMLKAVRPTPSANPLPAQTPKQSHACNKLCAQQLQQPHRLPKTSPASC